MTCPETRANKDTARVGSRQPTSGRTHDAQEVGRGALDLVNGAADVVDVASAIGKAGELAMEGAGAVIDMTGKGL